MTYFVCVVLGVLTKFLVDSYYEPLSRIMILIVRAIRGYHIKLQGSLTKYYVICCECKERNGHDPFAMALKT